MKTITLKQTVTLQLDPLLAAKLGLSLQVTYRKGVNSIPDELAGHWAIKAQTLK